MVVRLNPKRGVRIVSRPGVKIISPQRGMSSSHHPAQRAKPSLPKATSLNLVHPLLSDGGKYSYDVSVIFGTFNRLKHLKRCVESIRKACVDLKYEIVVGDGGSTDGTKAWIEVQPDIKYVFGGLDGAVKAFNACFEQVTGRCVLVFNDDAELQSDAIVRGLKYFQDPFIGQVAFAFKIGKDPYQIQEALGHPYANYGLIQTHLARCISGICGGLWAPVYRTYGGDNELSLWVLRLGYKIAKAHDARVLDSQVQDDLRKRSNSFQQRDSTGKLFASRWGNPGSLSFRGPHPNVDARTKQRLQIVEAGESPSVRWGRLAQVDPRIGELPIRCDLSRERVLQVFIQTDEDPQQSMVQGFAKLGSVEHVALNWLNVKDIDQRISAIAEQLKPTVVFLQLQRSGVVSLNTLVSIRQAVTRDPSMVMVLWSGDVGEVNGPWAGFQDAWSHQYSKVVDAMLYTGTGQVEMQRARGMQNAAYLQIGFDEARYYPATGPRSGVVFLGQNYGPQWNKIPENDAQIRRDVVQAFQKQVPEFKAYGPGWSNAESLHQTKAGDVYRRSLMSLSVSLTSKLGRYTSDRLFRAMACGTVPLVKRFEDMAGLGLVHGENALVWDTPGEAVALAHEWLRPEHREELLAMGAAAAALMKKDHTWGVRMQELSAILRALRNPT